MEFILYLAIILIATKLAGALSVKLGQPAVLGKLLAGIIIGPALLGWIHPDDFIGHFSEIGVLLLMFIAGLETDLDQLKSNWKASFAVALGGILLPFVGGYGMGKAFGLTSGQSMFLGLLMCATSVSISVQTLKEMNKLQTREGTTILGAAVVDDVVVVILLAVMMSVLLPVSDVSIGLVIGKKLIFFAVVLVAGWLLVPRFLKWFEPLKVTEAVMSAGLIVCFAFSYFAEEMGIAGIIGAFAAGIAISQTKFKHQVESKIEPIAFTLFVPVFFVSIGLHITFDGVGEQLWFIILLTIVACITKLIGGGVGARLTGFDNRSSLAIGAGMVSRGEVALIIAASGLESGLLLQKYFTSIVLVVILTTLITPPLLKMTLKERQRA
ncbi:cation:proton antiporter [Paenibacillus glycanilyticus]|uniref:Sodium:proton antiporter n=1 Tax=Paenibacillus glycanilyticus TaxID=126569 RepID=A0ABQ6GJ66_9BACL|nr:cation:proton antiporter [Paenibacillus glycanilyticus]GLX69677.1 sodium:proton antiporter [Paenibacillus glycanilyticus]